MTPTFAERGDAEATGIERLVREAVQRVLAREQAQATTADFEVTAASFNLDAALPMAQAAVAKGKELGIAIVFAAVDEAGNEILLHRMPDSLLGSIALAGDKAWSAAAFRQDTQGLGERAKESGDLFGLQSHSTGRICVFGGGIPVFVKGRIAGGIGVSGGTVEEDILIVEHALRAGRDMR